MDNEYNNGQSSFPDPLCGVEEKMSKGYGLSYAKAMFAQWIGSDYQNSLYGRRNSEMERCRDYAQVKKVDLETVIVDEALSMLNIDHKGLALSDRKILETIV